MKIIKTLILVFALTGCSSKVTIIQPVVAWQEQMHSEIGVGKTLWVSEVKSAQGNKEKLEKVFGKSLEVVAQTEFNKNGFSVLERRNFDLVVTENMFSNDIAVQNKLSNQIKASDYTAVITIVNMSVSDSGIGIPLIIFIKDYTVTSSIEMKIINNRTGEVSSYNGNFSAKKDYFNALIFIGTTDLNINDLVEYSYRASLNDAIRKVKI